MKCKKCGEIKLSKEFPPFKLHDDCQHPPLHCLRCVTSFWETRGTCSQCDVKVDESELNLRKCYSILETLFPEITCDDVMDYEGAEGIGGGTLTVTRLNGESFDTPFVPTMHVFSLKKKIEQFMKVSADKQSLLYNQKQLKDYKDDHSGLATLSDFSVKLNSTIHLMVLLYAIPSHLDKVVFDLYWGYPSWKRDYLDADAVTFNGQKWLEFADYRNRQAANGAIQHSGDMMDDLNRQGHHIIKVHLKSMPSDVTHVFFILSSYNSPTISHYKSPSMRFYEESNPEKMLCTEEISKAGHKQAIVEKSLGIKLTEGVR
ncbi:uncharacterized protein [Amphiura filiformis]|uniref:uncharacterized protein n=1 Tax=Amphiura filiformis TaxID=82378 RepID=UPI003B220E9C